MKRIFLALMISLSISVGFAAPALAAGTTSARDQVCSGVSGATGGSCASGGGDIQGVIRAVISILSVIVGIAAVIMIVVAGLKYVTSGGDSSSISSAKSTLIYAIVGLVVTAFAQFIVRFVLTETTPVPEEAPEAVTIIVMLASYPLYVI